MILILFYYINNFFNLKFNLNPNYSMEKNESTRLFVCTKYNYSHEANTSKIPGEKKFKYLRRDVRFKYRVKGAETRTSIANRG